MNDVRILMLDGGSQSVDSATLEALAGQLRGHLVTSESADYDEVRSIWNDLPPWLVPSGVSGVRG